MFCPFSNIPLAWCVLSHLLRQVWLGNTSQRHSMWTQDEFGFSLATRGPWTHVVFFFGGSSLFCCSGSFMYRISFPQRIVLSLRNANGHKPRGDLACDGNVWKFFLFFLISRLEALQPKLWRLVIFEKQVMLLGELVYMLKTLRCEFSHVC